MKYVIIMLAIACLSATRGLAKEQTMLARVTVYWHGAGPEQRACSNGARLRNGHCAVDPNKIPYGSKVLFPDGPCLAVDTGPAVVNRKAARLAGRTPSQRSAVVIDRYFENRKEALAWAASHPHFMTVQILHSQKRRSERDSVGAAISAAETITPAAAPKFPVTMTTMQKLKNESATAEVAMPPADIRGPLVPTFLASLLLD
jgi:3D (Asp-Asp-Asp) domain-containing protein